jgi:hypothetical protein
MQARAAGVRSVPMLFVDGEGCVKRLWKGAAERSELAELLGALRWQAASDASSRR